MSEQDHQHSSPIKTPKQLITVIVLSFVVPIILIILLATYVVGGGTSGAGSDAMTPEAIADRLRPIGTVAFAAAGGARTMQGGEAVYKLACAACHSAGVAGAPKTGDRAAWAPRIKQGLDVLNTHAVDGFKAMPAKGGNPDLDPVEVARAVVYMANLSGAKFAEPAAAAPAAATAAKGAAPVAVAAAGGKPDGAKVYASAGCNACHAAGVAGAPKFGDRAAWATRSKQGLDALTAVVIKGKGAMPPKGGASGASDAELRAAIEYMLAAAR